MMCRPVFSIYEVEINPCPSFSISFVANVGGLMGLCIGFSFVSVVELVCFMCKSNKWIVCRRLRQRPAIKPFSKKGKKQGRPHKAR